MSESRQDSSKPEADQGKKATDTLHLTAEDLKKINGGVNQPKNPVQPQEIRHK